MAYTMIWLLDGVGNSVMYEKHILLFLSVVLTQHAPVYNTFDCFITCVTPIFISYKATDMS